MKTIKKFAAPVAIAGTILLGVLPQVVSAQGFFPEPIQNLLDLLGPGGSGTGEFVTSRVSTLLIIFLGIIILAAVVFTAFAAFKYIQSQGDEGQVQEARKGIEAIFQGIAIMLIAIVGIVIIFVFFGAEIFSPSLYQTCISAPNSPGCNACTAEDGGLPDNWDEVKFELFPAFRANAEPALSGNFGLDNYTDCSYCEWWYFEIATNDTVTEIPAGPVRDGCTE